MSDDEKSHDSKEGENEEGEENEDEGNDNEEESEDEGEGDEDNGEGEEDDKEESENEKSKENDHPQLELEVNKTNESNAIKLDKPQGGTFASSSENPPKNQSLLSILEEISNDMDNLATLIQSNFIYQSLGHNSIPISSIPDNRHKITYTNDKDQINQLLAQAQNLSKAIDKELKDNDYLINNTNINYIKEETNQSQFQIEPQPLHKEVFDNKPYLPYDPNIHKNYYLSLNANKNNKSSDYNPDSYIKRENNNHLTLNNSAQNINGSQVIRNDNRINKLPIIYSQHSNEMGSSIESYNNNYFHQNDEFLRTTSNLLPYNNSGEYDSTSLRNNHQQKRENPFERY